MGFMESILLFATILLCLPAFGHGEEKTGILLDADSVEVREIENVE